MRLNVTSKGADEKKHNESVRRGKNAKRKGGNYERKIAKLFQERYGVELKRTPQSGGFAKKSNLADDYRGDITIVDPKNYLKLHIEVKNCKELKFKAWINQAETDCPKNRIPIVIFHKYNTSDDFVILSVTSLFELLKTSCSHKDDSSNLNDDIKEEWRQIVEYPDYYVSNLGRIKSIKKGITRILKPGIGSSGYLNVAVLNGSRESQKTVRVHKLVAKYFLKDYSEDLIVNHIDGNKLNNCISNLEMTTYSGNLSHAYKTGLRKKGENLKCAKLNDVTCFRIRNLLNKGIPVKDIANNFEVSEITIIRLKDNKYRNPYNLYCYTPDKNILSHSQKWLEEYQLDCPSSSIPTIYFYLSEGEDFVCLNLRDFFSIVEKDKVIAKRSFRKEEGK